MQQGAERIAPSELLESGNRPCERRQRQERQIRREEPPDFPPAVAEFGYPLRVPYPPEIEDRHDGRVGGQELGEEHLDALQPLWEIAPFARQCLQLVAQVLGARPARLRILLDG